MLIVTLVFENFGENINKIFWDAYSLTTTKSGGCFCGLGDQITLVLEDNNRVKDKPDLTRT